MEVNNLSSGDLELKFDENGLKNTVVLQANGKILIDGAEVILINKKAPIEKFNAVDPSPRAYSSSFSTTPYTTGGSYSSLLAEYRETAISIGNQLFTSIGAGALTTILVACFSKLLSIALVAGAIVGLATGLRNTAIKYGLETAYFSCRILKYGKPSNTSYNSYYKYAGTYYIAKTLTGYNYPHTYYEYRYFN